MSVKKGLLVGVSAGLAAAFIGYGLRRKNKSLKGLCLKAKKGVSVSLYKGVCGEDEPVLPDKTEENGEHICFFYNNLAENDGGYHYKAEKEGYCTLTKKIYYPKEKADKFNLINITLYKLCDGFCPKEITEDTDEVTEKLLPVNEEWKQRYKAVYETPTLSNGEKGLEFTTDAEMESFISKIEGECDYLYRYCAAEVAYEESYKIPLLIFTKTNIKDCLTYKEAAIKMEKSGRPVVMYEAQIHGNEPAGGDGALAVMKALSGEFGQEILSNISVIIIPRVNPAGTRAFIRKNRADGFDMNRDNMKSVSVEISAVHDIFNTFLPVAVIDGHEYKTATDGEKPYKDVLLGMGGGFNTTRELSLVGSKAINYVISELNKENIRATYYHASGKAGAVEKGYVANTANFSTCRGYYSLKGCISLLVETRGIGIGKQGYERRLVSQFIIATSLLKYISENTEEIKAAVSFERRRIIEQGKTFNPDNLFGLYTSSSFEKYEETKNPVFNLLSGEVKDPDNTAKNYYYDIALRTRARATAFVVSKESGDKITGLINKHGISHKEIFEDVKISLRQYSAEVEPLKETPYYKVKDAVLSEEKIFEFKNGVYVFPANQLSGTLLMYLFEPDINDTENFGSTLCQSGLLKPEEIYRYEHDLKPDGSIKEER